MGLLLVLVDGSSREDGGLRVSLDQYEVTPRTAEPLCRSEDELRRAHRLRSAWRARCRRDPPPGRGIDGRE
jgi:hypothetical protein